MFKLIKLSETHYVIVDDSEIKEGDYVYRSLTKKDIYQIDDFGLHLHKRGSSGDGYKKITHSTQPLHTYISNNRDGSEYIGHHYGNVAKISLSEVQRAINEYNVEDLAHNVMMNYLTNGNPDGDFTKSTVGADDNKNWWIQGFNAHKKLVENKLMFDVEEFKDISHSFFSLYRTNEFSDDELELKFENILNNIIQKFSSKNVWDVEFNKERKLILIK